MLQTNYTSYKYNPNEINEKDFLEKFVIRNDIFEDIFEDIKNVDFNVSNQHYIIVGQRGQGKTSLLRRISIAIKDDKKLAKFMIPIKFSEEQYQIRSLCRFFEVIAEELQENNSEIFPNILDNLESHIDDEDYYSKCFEHFDEMVKSQNKKLIILSDNIDELLGKLKEQEQRQLRQILITSSTIRIVGASTKMIEQHFDYAKPFYEYFKIIKLDGLDYDESIKFLRVIGDKEQNKKIEEIIKNSPQRIETLRQLTGGVPRTLVMLYDIFIKNNETAFEDLLKILDDVTVLYKDRMDNLPSTLQDIVHNIALNWDGITTKELAKKTRLESKSVSSQLKQLEKYHIIEFESTGKNKIYKIKERFFNIWYLMRFGRKKDRNKVEWLVKFLTSWYDRDELNIKAKNFINTIKDKNLNENYVYHMCEGLSYAGLDLEIEHQMKQNTKEYFNKQKSSLSNDLAKSDTEILQEAFILNDNDKQLEAIDLLKESHKSSLAIVSIIAAFYHLLNEYKKAEEYYLKAIQCGSIFALNDLAILYNEKKEYTKAEEYYLKAIESGDNIALRNLGNLYKEQKEYDKTEMYYLKAIEMGDNDALNSFSWFYFEQAKKIDKARDLIKQSYSVKQSFYNVHTFAIILLWNEELEESYTKFLDWLEYDNALESENDIIEYLNLLIAKGQLYKAKEFLEMPKYQLKDRYKPIWYALMTLMENDFPNEIKKMGSELNQSVGEILEVIEVYKEKYAI
jgi:tetratricopeptide (TPR) repeat protein